MDVTYVDVKKILPSCSIAMAIIKSLISEISLSLHTIVVSSKCTLVDSYVLIFYISGSTYISTF